MKRLIVAICLVMAWSGYGRAAVLEFDDLENYDRLSDYGGLGWSNFYALDPTLFSYSGYLNSMVSPNIVLFNGHASTSSVYVLDGASTFDFNSAYIGAAWNDGLSVDVVGYLDGFIVYSQTVLVETDSSMLFNFDYLGIDEVRFTSYGGIRNPEMTGLGQNLAMDNFTYNETSAPAHTPEPSTFILAGLGLLGLVGFRKRFAKQ